MIKKCCLHVDIFSAILNWSRQHHVIILSGRIFESDNKYFYSEYSPLVAGRYYHPEYTVVLLFFREND